MTTKLKRVKKATPIITIKTYEEYEVQCPHCKTYLIGGYSKSTLRFLCSRCKQPIELIWD